MLPFCVVSKELQFLYSGFLRIAASLYDIFILRWKPLNHRYFFSSAEMFLEKIDSAQWDA